MKSKISKFILIGSIVFFIISIIIGAIYTFFSKKVNNETSKIDEEIKMSMQYEQVTNEADFYQVDGTEFVKFGAYFTRDLNDDGYAEKLLGACRRINETDTLFMDLNVITNGYLKDGNITITKTNFKYSMNMVKDTVLAEHYISDDVEEIKLNNVQAGTQKLILGNIISDIKNNINNYSGTAQITLTGTHVNEITNEETPISKTIEVKVDWHGETKASFAYQSNVLSYRYKNLSNNSFLLTINTNEELKELILKENNVIVTIPELNGYKAIDAKCQNSNTIFEFNGETGELEIRRLSKVLDNGQITNALARNNSYGVLVTYPKEAFDAINNYAELTIPIKTYYEGYNNNSEQSEFANPFKSNIQETNIKVVLTDLPEGFTYNFDVDIMNKTYIDEPYFEDAISKQNILNLYDSDELVYSKNYTIRWRGITGEQGNTDGLIMKEQDGSNYADKYDNRSIENYTANTGIYFEGATEMLGEDGQILVYNDETNELIKAFTKSAWEACTKDNPFRYEQGIKHIRVETSNTNINSTLSVYNIKELNIRKILQDFTKEEFKNINYVYTYLKGICIINGDTTSNIVNDSDYALYFSKKSYASITFAKNIENPKDEYKIPTQETTYNKNIYIEAKARQNIDAKWKNGIFLVEMPEEIINMEVNSVTTNNSEVQIVAYDIYKENNKYLLKIITSNDKEQEFKITVNCNITPNPQIPTDTKQVRLYAVNKNCGDYHNLTKDVFDLNGNNNVEEQVGTYSTDLMMISPTSLITLETISNYNENDESEITIAPNIALVDKEENQATINMILTNNYPFSITNTKIIGKIPFEGNTYIINGKDMYSEFNTQMTESGIIVPEELRSKAIIYYSENENPGLDINDSNNGWTTSPDFTKVKTYLIDLQDSELNIGKTLKFSYVLNIPDNINLNQVAFSNHAVYFDLKTEGGKLSLETEPSKVGLRIVKKFELDIYKYKRNSDLTIPGVVYTLKYNERNIENETVEKTRILTTNKNGQIKLENLIAEKTYKLREISVPDNCELNDEEIEFKVNGDSTITMVSNENTSLKNAISYSNDIVKIDLEDEVKFDVEINKTKIGSNIPINNVRFKVQDENENKKFANTVNGIAKIEGLSLNKEYTLQEIAAPGNITKAEGTIVFKVIRNSQGQVVVQTISNSLAKDTPSVEDLPNILNPIVKLNIENEIRYNLNLTKKESGSSGKNIKGVKFKITGNGFGANGTNLVTSDEGKITITNLIVGEEYTLEEVEAQGYYLDNTQKHNVIFKVERNNGKLQITKWQSNGISQSYGRSLVESSNDLSANINNVVFYNEKIPTYNFNIVKENEEGVKLAGTQFKLTRVDDEKTFTATTNEQGIASFEGLFEYVSSKNFVTGKYILEESYVPAGYGVDNTKLEFKASKVNGKLEINILGGEGLIKETEGVKAIESDGSGITITIVNKSAFKLVKKNEQGELLPNTKFKITDLQGNIVRGTDGKFIGAPENLDSVDISFTESGDYPWEKNGDIWRSTNQNIDNSNSILKSNEFTLDKTMIISFDWSVSSESVSYDYVWYTITNTNTNRVVSGGTSTKIGGTTYGTSESNLSYLTVEKELSPGTYTIEFTYKKDGATRKGTDTAYVKNLTIIEKPDAQDCVIETDENGEINAKISQGLYKAVEIEAPSGYELPKNEQDRTYKFGIGVNQPEKYEYILDWKKTFSSEGVVSLKDIVKDNDGNFVAIGTFFENININDATVEGKGDFDGIIIKFDQSGNIIWYKTIGGEGVDELSSIAVNPTGGYVIAGYSDSDNLYYSNGENSIASANFGLEDGFFIKISDDGTFNYCKVIGGVGTDKINGVTVNQNGIIAVVGSYMSSDMYLNGDKNDASSTIKNSRKNGTEISPTDKKNAFISVYTNGGEYIWSQNITGRTNNSTDEAWISSVVETNYGFAVSLNINGSVYLNTEKSTQISSTGKVDGVVVHYTNNGESIKYQKVGGASNDELYDIIQDINGNIIVVGSYSGTISLNYKSHISKGKFDIIVAKFNQNLDCLNSVSFGGTADDSMISISETEDGGYLLGGWTYSTQITDSDETNKISVSGGRCKGLTFKLNDDLQMQSYEYIGGDGTIRYYYTVTQSYAYGYGYNNIYGVVEANAGEIITLGDFDATSLRSKNTSLASNTGYADSLIAKFKSKVTEAEVSPVTRLEITNKMKQLKITTEVGLNSDNQRTGGTITGDAISGEAYKKLVEIVNGTTPNTKDIVITPSINYGIASITVNGEKYKFIQEADGKVTIPAGTFEDITEDIHIVVIFEENIKQVIVHHYLKNADGTYTTTKVADDEAVLGKLGKEYVTVPKNNLAEYVLEKDSTGEYVIPENASGIFRDTNEDVTYYYEVRKPTLIINHYLEGTETKVAESSVEEYAKGYEYETSKSTVALQDYDFVYVDGDEKGVLNEDTVVNYYYKNKEYMITTEVIKNSETNILGGTITGEYNSNFKEENGIKFVEKVNKNEESTETIEVIPDFGYKVKTIILESTDENNIKTSKVIFGENKDENLEVQAVEGETGKITLTKFNSVTENKHIKVEFEALENSIIVHHYLKEKNDLTTKKVAEDEIIKVQVGQETNIKPKEDLQTLHLAKNSDGTDMLPKAEVNNETGIIEVSYYYEPDDITLVLSHYLADTNERIVEDEVIRKTPNMLQDENGYYTIIESEMYNYKLEDNENYKKITDDKYLVSIAGDYSKNYEIGEKLEYTYTYNSNSEIKYFYKVKESYEFIVNYYYDGVIDETKTETKTVHTGDIISDYTDNNITGYKLEKAKIINNDSEEVDLPYLVKGDLNIIVLNVYYIKDTFNYKIKYFYDGIEDESKQKNLSAEFESQISNYPEENKEDYVFEGVKTINDNSEEIDLPLIISEDESKNIINVYYIRTKTFKFVKEWKNIPQSEADNYKSTFKLMKTVNEETSDYIDINRNIVTKTVIGNGQAEFENIRAFEGTNSIEYSVEEIKVEKTNDNGNTWQELASDEYKAINRKSSNTEGESELETVENTLTPSYKIKKEWKTKNPSNYKATFKLMKTIDGVTQEATDDSGSIITKTITGNGTATFTNLKPYEDEKAISYSAVETKIEKTEDEWATSNEVDMNLFIITHKEEAGFDDVFVNVSNNKFSLDINITEDTENLPLDGIEFTISIKDEQENSILTENKTYTSGTNGNLIEIADDLPIDSENKTFTVTITQNTSKEGYRKIQTPVTFQVTSKLADNGISYVLVPENKEVTNTKGVEVEENSILVKLQNSYIAEYEVHYFYDGIEDVEAKASYETTVGKAVENYESKPQGMVLEKAKALNAEGVEVNLPLTVRKDKTNNKINVYYRTQYKITTKVNKHDEIYTNKTETNVAGGTISGEGLSVYENVFKGDSSTKQIKITPDEGYAISSVKVNGEEKLPDLTEKINATDESLTLAVTGGTNIAGGYFTNILENKEVEVEFRKKTKITVKYLEKGTKAVLAEEKVIEGLEGDSFGKTDEKHIIDRVAVNNYKETTVTAVKRQGGNIDTEISGEIVDGVIKESFAEIKEDETGKKYAEGTMFADEITLIYWYEKIPSGVWVRHVEIDEVGKINGEKTELKPVEKLTFTDNSKEVLREEFEGYVSVDCPNNMAPLVNGIVQDGNIVAKANENAKTVTYSAGTTVEVWFFYEKEHKITTEVVPHKEIINEEEKDVLGGTISKNYKLDEHGNVTDEEEEFFEKVLHRGNSSKKIEIVPQEGYKIKQILIDEEEQDLASLVKEDGTASIDAGTIQDIKKDISVKVEFEKIPAKVIVKYIDIETDEEILNQKEVDGFVGDTYNEPRVPIEGYKEAGENPINAGGTMKKEQITVTYYYQRLRKIKTEVKLHEETKNGSSIMVKGGAILGDGLDVYEYVEKGNSSIKEILITPESGYKIKSVKINNVEQEITVNEDGTYTLPQFTNVTEDIYVVVEFTQIPAKVKVLYLETVKQDGEDVEKEIADQDVKNVFINDEYKTEPKMIEFYKLIETKMPENQNGVVTEDEITVKYYYERLPFNMKVEKEISKIMLNDVEQEVTDSSKAKVEINYENINDVKLEISYRIKVTNTEKLAGKIVLEEIVPKGFELVLDENGKMWTKQENSDNEITKILDGTQYALETEEIKPGETKEYIVTLKWVPNILNQGTIINVAQIGETKNAANYKETTLNDNISEAKIEIELNKIAGPDDNFGEDVNNENITNNKTKEVPQTGQTRVIYIVLGMMIAMSAAGVIAITYKVRKDK